MSGPVSFADLGGTRYGVISADPAWLFKVRTPAGEGKSPQRHYRCMSIDEICAMPVADLAARNCALFLWTTWPILLREDAPVHRVIRAWGFKPSGLAWEWIKWNPKTGNYAFCGGYGSRKNVEPCLLGRRGNPRRLDATIRDFLFAPRREHSRKPDEHYERCQRMFPGPRLELFARQRRVGWDAWGDEADKFPAGKIERAA